MIKKPFSLLKVSAILILPISIGVIGILSVGQTRASIVPNKQTLPLPEIISPSQAVIPSAEESNPQENWSAHRVTIKPNDSLSIVLDRLNLNKRVSYDIRQLKQGRIFTQLNVGDELQIWLDENKDLQKIVYPKSKTLRYELSRSEQGYQIVKKERPVEIKIVTTYGTIKDSLYLSGQAAGLSGKSIMGLADIFNWEIDFIRQLRPNDPFKIIYEKKYINDQYIGDGDILAAQIFTGRHQLHSAYLLKDEKGKKIGYYDINNKNLKKAFLRNPVDYVRISSRFQPRRYHPFLKKFKAHRGVDYAGPTGTPIHATGDGKIIKRYLSRSYGNVIFIQHAHKYTTVYGHMSKFGKYKKGQWVKQGATIGYIGSTGYATGPHLHYEFRISGKHVDPLKVKFPAAGPVPKKYLNKFKKYASLMHDQFTRINPSVTLARNFE